MVIQQYDVFWVTLDPTIGHEIKKTRPCVVVSPNEVNQHIATLIIAPLTSQSHPYPTRIPTTFGKKKGWIVLDQARTIDKRRLFKKIGSLDDKTVQQIKSVFREMLVD